LDRLEQAFVSTVERVSFSAEIEKILLQLFQLSKTFAAVVFQFMVTQHETYGASTGLTIKARWSLVHHLLRILFKDIVKVRRKAVYIMAKNTKHTSAEYF
jgi:hypothetical protein